MITLSSNFPLVLMGLFLAALFLIALTQSINWYDDDDRRRESYREPYPDRYRSEHGYRGRGRYEDDYDGYDEYRQRPHYGRHHRYRRGGSGIGTGLIMLCLFVGGVAALSKSGPQKSAKAADPDQTTKFPTQITTDINPSKTTIYKPEPDLPSGEKKQVSDMDRSEPVTYDTPVNTAEKPASEPGCILQTSCLSTLEAAQYQAEKMGHQYHLANGVIQKELNGLTVFAVYLGPFESNKAANHINDQYNLKGMVLPCADYKTLGNWVSR